MTTAQLIALGIVLAALAYLFLGGEGVTATKGKHGLAMLKAGEAAGRYGAAVIIEERLGESEARRFLKSFSEGVAEPSTPPPSPPKS